jgi:hypothetical protein
MPSSARTSADGPTLVSIDFRHAMDPETFAAKMAAAAPIVAETPGLVWKVWSADPATGHANGAYLFASAAAARFYLASVFPNGPGADPAVSDIEAEVLPVMAGPSRLTRAPLD